VLIIVNPPALKARPKLFNRGKCWKWQVLQLTPTWRAKAGTAWASEGDKRDVMVVITMAKKKKYLFMSRPPWMHFWADITKN
jgi:hypothetical protein